MWVAAPSFAQNDRMSANEALPAATSTQDVINNNPIKLYISKDAPSFELAQLKWQLWCRGFSKAGSEEQLTLKQVEQDSIGSRFLTRSALGRFGPSVSFNTFYSSSSLNQMLFFPADTSLSSAPMQPVVRGTSLSIIFAATQPLLTGGRLLGGYRAAHALRSNRSLHTRLLQ